MNIALYSPNGGSGTSTLTYNLAYDLDFILSHPDDPTMKHHNNIYDLDSTLTTKSLKILQSCDLIMIPTRIDEENIKETLKSIKQLEHYAPIMIIVNNFNHSVYNKYKNLLHPLPQKDLFYIKESESMRESKNRGKFISDLHKDPNSHYHLDSEFYGAYLKILEKIKSYQEVSNTTTKSTITKMGRPIKNVEKKDKKISGYLTKSEFEEFEEFILDKDMTIASLVRKAVLVYIKNH